MALFPGTAGNSVACLSSSYPGTLLHLLHCLAVMTIGHATRLGHPSLWNVVDNRVHGQNRSAFLKGELCVSCFSGRSVQMLFWVYWPQSCVLCSQISLRNKHRPVYEEAGKQRHLPRSQHDSTGSCLWPFSHFQFLFGLYLIFCTKSKRGGHIGRMGVGRWTIWNH